MSAEPFPTVKHETFLNPPLKAMFGQIRFPARLQLLDPASLGPLQAAIEECLPEFAEEQQINVTIGPGAPPQHATAKSYRFSTSDGLWGARIAPDSLTLEASPGSDYSSYDRFRELFGLTWNALLEHVRPARVVHQGLRYIDHIEGDRPPVEWADYINPDLLGALNSEQLADGLFRAVSELRLQREDGVIVFRHGIAEAGPENRPGYLLDFDYFNSQPTEEFSTETLLARFDAFHDLLYAFFRWCLTDNALKEFRRDGN